MVSPPLIPRVLVVDDNQANRAAFETILERHYVVSMAESGPKALELALREEFAVILLDVRMPGMDGFETAELLRRRERTRTTPIIFMSAYDQSAALMRNGYVAGATEFLSSPVDEELLLFKVEAYARLRERHEEMRARIRRLNILVESMQVDVNLRDGARDGNLKGKIDELESLLGQLSREMSPVPA